MNDVESGRLNRRAFLRVPSAMPCKLVCLMPDGSLPEDGWADAEIVEIGGGGARVETDLQVEMGCVLSLRLPVPDTGNTVRLSARVISVAAEQNPRQVGVKFVGLSARDRGLLIRYVFAAQMRMAGPGPGRQETGNKQEDR
jgi:c-di-GMP-binding flagellar brake protein YcgR